MRDKLGLESLLIGLPYASPFPAEITARTPFEFSASYMLSSTAL